MLFFFIGLILVPLKFFNIFGVGDWSWVFILSPFAMAVIWWLVFNPFSRVQKKQAQKISKDRADKLFGEKMERLGYSDTEIKRIKEMKEKDNLKKAKNNPYYD